MSVRSSSMDLRGEATSKYIEERMDIEGLAKPSC